MSLLRTSLLFYAFALAALLAPRDVFAESVAEIPFKGRIATNAKDSAEHWERVAAKAPPGAPNIVLIMLDDVGFADTSTFGGLALTPELDQLASRGLRYNQFHTVGICAPTRAALLSGRNHHRIGFGGFGGVGFPGYSGVWNEGAASIAEVLQRNGYSTAAFGKWHNTPLWEVTPYGPFDRWPTGLGFQYFYGNMIGMSSQWEPPLWRNTLPVQQPATPQQGYHFTTDIANEAITWIRTHQSLAPDNPYFVYFATGAAHTPHHVPKQWIDKYRGKFDQGWDKLREQIFIRQKKIGVIPKDAELTPRPDELPAWDSLSQEEKQAFANQMEAYAAFISHTDHEVGRLIRAVQAGPGSDNTLILYIVGDNGAEGALGVEGAAALFKLQDEQFQPPDELGRREYYMYSSAWGWMGNTPFQGSKPIASHFGATRNPLVVSWPARINDAGGLRSQFSHVVDIAPTLYEAARITPPDSVGGVPQQTLDGVSLVSTFSQAGASPHHRVQYFEVLGNRAIYQDGWVAAARPDISHDKMEAHDYSSDRWELYHVAEDFSQARDVADKYPDKLKELRSLFDTEARKNNVYPLGVPLFGMRSPSWMNGKTEFIYGAGFPSVPLFSGAVPDFMNGPHRIVAEATIPNGGGEGVIIAGGGRMGGFTLFLKENRLIYESNFPGASPERITSGMLLPSGQVQLAVELGQPDTDGSVDGRLFVNGEIAGKAQLSRMPTSDRFDNFDVGQDSASPVSSAYEAPFKFNGFLNSVRIEMK